MSERFSSDSSLARFVDKPLIIRSPVTRGFMGLAVALNRGMDPRRVAGGIPGAKWFTSVVSQYS